MVGQLSMDQLKQHAPHSRILAFRPEDSGSPMQDWCRHLSRNPLHRRELEEFAILGDVVIRIADELEPDPLQRVKIMSLEYAVKVLGNEEDGREFVRCVKAIASPDAGQFEYEQIAAYYYGEIRRRGASEVLKEMGLLGLAMHAVTSTIADRETGFEEIEIGEQRLTVADQRRVQEAAKYRKPLPPRTPNFDEELAAVTRRVGSQKISRMVRDEFADFYLDDHGKTLEELDEDFISYAAMEQFDEGGLIGLTMNGGQTAVVVCDFETEIDSSYLPPDLRYLGAVIGRLYVGHAMGGDEVRKARQLIESAAVANFGFDCVPQPSRFVNEHSDQPLSDGEFSEWLGAKLDEVYDGRALRSVRRIRHSRCGSFEYLSTQEVNPDFEEMQYVAAVCGILWNKQKADFHLRSLRNRTYQGVYSAVRNTSDTADVAGLKKEAYSLFKERHALSLKEFTALNTVAKSQESRLAGKISATTRRWLRDIETATQARLRYLKYNLYNDGEAKALTRQEKQRLWDAVRARDAAIQAEARTKTRSHQGELFKVQALPKAFVKVTPVGV